MTVFLLLRVWNSPFFLLIMETLYTQTSFKNVPWERKLKVHKYYYHFSLTYLYLFYSQQKCAHMTECIAPFISITVSIVRANRTIVWFTFVIFVINDWIEHLQVTALHIHHMHRHTYTHNRVKPVYRLQWNLRAVCNQQFTVAENQ
jgi:hypothetical protein